MTQIEIISHLLCGLNHTFPSIKPHEVYFDGEAHLWVKAMVREDSRMSLVFPPSEAQKPQLIYELICARVAGEREKALKIEERLIS